ncbi:MAG: iron-sulfur cluster assembly scaffold protein [Rhodothermales bacterium]
MGDSDMEVIMDHYRQPRNRGKLTEADVDCEDVNPACGDRVRMQAILNDADEIAAVRFVGDGCVISMAAASLLTTLVEGRSLKEVVQFPEASMLEALEASVSPRRYDCALLAHRTLKAGLVRLAHDRRVSSS